MPALGACAALLALAGCSQTEETVKPPPASEGKGLAAAPAASTPAATTPAAPAPEATSGEAGSSSSATTAAVAVKTLPSVGPVLVNPSGRTLYIFVPDNHAKVTCVGECAGIWPPLKTYSAGKPTGGAGISAKLLGLDTDPEGGKVITYAGWPLYTYAADSSSGTDTGQGLDVNGGLWYVISPAGKVITAK